MRKDVLWRHNEINWGRAALIALVRLTQRLCEYDTCVKIGGTRRPSRGCDWAGSPELHKRCTRAPIGVRFWCHGECSSAHVAQYGACVRGGIVTCWRAIVTCRTSSNRQQRVPDRRQRAVRAMLSTCQPAHRFGASAPSDAVSADSAPFPTRCICCHICRNLQPSPP